MDQEMAEALAQKTLEAVGAAQSLFLAMRLVVLVGQQASDDPEILEAAKDAIAGIKRLGTLARVLQPT